jgi:hypothetical protein
MKSSSTISPHSVPATIFSSQRWRQHLMRALDALGAGGSAIPFGDNGDVFRALAASRERQLRNEEGC